MIINFTPFPISESSEENFTICPLRHLILDQGGFLTKNQSSLEKLGFNPREHIIENIIHYSENFIK